MPPGRLPASVLLVVLLATTARAGGDGADAGAPGDASRQEAQPAERTDSGAPSDEDTYPLTRDALDVLFQSRQQKEPTPPEVGRVYMTLLPGISTSPSTGVLVALTGQGVFLTGPADSTSASQAQAVVAFTSLRQLFLAVRSQVYLPRDSVALIGDWRLWDNVERTYGLGSESAPEAASRVEFAFVRFDEQALFGLARHWFLGAGVRVDWFTAVRDAQRLETGRSPLTDYGVGADGSLSVGPSLAAMYDSRDTQVRPTRGLFAQLSLRLYPRAFGSTTTWFEVWGELRGYHRPVANSSRQVLAAWLYAWATVGDAPYLNLPASAWDARGRSARGYAAGRFRGPAQLYAEVEYRVGITPGGTVGAVAYFNLTTFSATRGGAFEAPAPGGGVGVRLLLNKETGAYLAVDTALGVRSSGVYFTLGEAF